MLESGATTRLSLRFSQAEFDEFARLSGDDNPIHVDPDFSSRTRFGKTVAHGMLLFGVLDAAVSRWLGRDLPVLAQELTFRAPTFAEDDLTATLICESAAPDEVQIAQRLVRSDGTETAAGSTVLGAAGTPNILGDPPPAGGELHGVRPGMTAAARRTITAADVAAYHALVDDPTAGQASGTVPPALLGGLVSHLLGVELPGRGTNWLRQRYVFHRPVPAGTPITTTVEVLRVRPDKALVDLATTSTIDAGPAVTGRALVLIADLERA